MKNDSLQAPYLLACTLLCAMLGACESVAPAPPPPSLFRDERFAAPVQRIDADEVFALSAEMKRFVHSNLMRSPQGKGGPQALIDALNRRDQVRLEYDSAQTRNAAQTFAARKGNCLSLVLMTAAIAKELRLNVTYQLVDTDEVWSRSDNIAFLSTHVNLTLGRRAADTLPGYDPARLLTVDFLPAQEILGQHRSPLPERTIVAMYLNNRAAESLVHGLVDDAYWWARAATMQAPDFAPAYNTLGVVYLRHGDLAAAEAILDHVLARKAQDKQALSNLAIVLEKLGRSDQAAALRTRLERMDPFPPYCFFFLGQEAMRQGDYQTAKEQFAKEVDRAEYNSEFHFWLGLADLKLGNLAEARHQVTLAMASSTDTANRDLYAAKLERLRSFGRP